jgi:hypothetical protein
LLNFGLGAIAKNGSRVPIYFTGVVQGYEEQAWAGLYDTTSSDTSPLINSLEASESSASLTCPNVDAFPLTFNNDTDLDKTFFELHSACKDGTPDSSIREINHNLSWGMLKARLDAIPLDALKRLSKTASNLAANNVQPEADHVMTNQMILAAAAYRI